MSRFTTCCLFALLILTGPLARAQSESESEPEASTVAAPSPASPFTDTSSFTAASVATAAPADTWEGKVSYFARKFTGRKTASGERFDPNALTMAHKSLPFGTVVRVTNLRNGKSVHVRVNDRGPFVVGRVADLSLAAARTLDMLHAGVAQAKLEVISAFD